MAQFSSASVVIVSSSQSQVRYRSHAILQDAAAQLRQWIADGDFSAPAKAQLAITELRTGLSARTVPRKRVLTGGWFDQAVRGSSNLARSDSTSCGPKPCSASQPGTPPYWESIRLRNRCIPEASGTWAASGT